MREMNCSGSFHEKCGPLCQQKISKLEQTGDACTLLNAMCTSVDSPKLGVGHCRLDTGAQPSTWEAFDSHGALNLKDCKHFCVTDIGCTAYSYGRMRRICSTVSPNKPTEIASLPHLSWKRHRAEDEYGPITKTDNTPGLMCYFKACHRIVQSLLDVGRSAALATLLLGVFLILSSLAACFFIITVSTRKGWK